MLFSVNLRLSKVIFILFKVNVTLILLTWENTTEEDLNFVDVFSPFRNYLPLENGVSPPLNKLEFTSPNDALPKLWMKFARWLWRRFFFLIVNVLSLFYCYIPLEEDVAIHLFKVSLIHPMMLYTKMVLWFLSIFQKIIC